MKYQAIKHNKSGSRALLKMCDTLAEAVQAIKTKGGRFSGLSYVGGFPTFLDERHKLYSVQGSFNGIVVSLSTKEAETAATL